MDSELHEYSNQEDRNIQNADSLPFYPIQPQADSLPFSPIPQKMFRTIRNQLASLNAKHRQVIDIGMLPSSNFFEQDDDIYQVVVDYRIGAYKRIYDLLERNCIVSFIEFSYKQKVIP